MRYTCPSLLSNSVTCPSNIPYYWDKHVKFSLGSCDVDGTISSDKIIQMCCSDSVCSSDGSDPTSRTASFYKKCKTKYLQKYTINSISLLKSQSLQLHKYTINSISLKESENYKNCDLLSCPTGYIEKDYYFDASNRRIRNTWTINSMECCVSKTLSRVGVGVEVEEEVDEDVGVGGENVIELCQYVINSITLKPSTESTYSNGSLYFKLKSNNNITKYKVNNTTYKFNNDTSILSIKGNKLLINENTVKSIYINKEIQITKLTIYKDKNNSKTIMINNLQPFDINTVKKIKKPDQILYLDNYTINSIELSITKEKTLPKPISDYTINSVTLTQSRIHYKHGDLHIGYIPIETDNEKQHDKSSVKLEQQTHEFITKCKSINKDSNNLELYNLLNDKEPKINEILKGLIKKNKNIDCCDKIDMSRYVLKSSIAPCSKTIPDKYKKYGEDYKHVSEGSNYINSNNKDFIIGYISIILLIIFMILINVLK